MTWNHFAFHTRVHAVAMLLVCFSTAFALPCMAEDSQPAKPAPLTTSDPNVPLEDLQVMVKPLTQEELAVEADAWFNLLKSKARQIAAVKLGVRKTSKAIVAEDNEVATESLEEAKKVRALADRVAKNTEDKIVQAARNTIDSEPNEASPDPASEAQSDSETTADADEATTESPAETPAEQTTDASAHTPAEDAAEMKTQLLEDIAELQDQRTSLSDRLTIVLNSWEEKGGDTESYRQYITAVSGVELDTTDAEAVWSTVVGWFGSKEGGQRWAWNIIKFVLILVIAYLLSKILSGGVNWLLDRKIHLSQLAERLIANTIRNVLLAVGFAVALTALEVDIAPIIAAIGATGLVVGLALQDTLSNFASGLMILVNRPFDVGDVVNAGGVTGTVHQMNLVSTTFHTFDNQTIYVPNNEIWNNVITNITANDKRRVDMEFGIGYSDDFEQAEQIITEVVKAHDSVLDEPEPVVVTHALADSSVNIVCRPWAATSDWWKVKTDVTREVKRRFDAAGISIPFPQQDVHVYQTATSEGDK
ncbi:mechanosensitive ion channel domain-containing protein [Rhodopirellula sallentina]|uniref:Small conductance mechanosensitive ion channel n=1 Tax=Rhodopirellula sallentina SM41 TaxID=1263870 RepID=M5U2F6_9BACT|nr:mechanosensitive ion channel domain-containing protein [Rhodopirellula sallentina]EMI55620.1 small conductance mechanosensitive ion channel [Rhodopirellula sallentina SM41]